MQDSMDIRKWLDETVPPEAPRESNDLHQTAEPAERKRRRRSDSSMLDPRPPASSPHASLDDSADEALQATCSDSSSSTRYARKPRRKTRPERYEPGSHAHRHRKDESKKTRRKPRRKRGDKPPGAMQTFQAKNVSGDRLTLKPREQLGLFNKGRTSTAIKGRGLPDLVFSEMKFLQKHKDKPESVPRPDASKKKRKKDNEQTKEGEISAFFTSARLALVEKDKNTLPQHSTTKTKPCRHGPSSVDDTAITTVEAVNQASYLGFGSRGPRHENNSYVSWSESFRAPSTAPERPRNSYIHPSSGDADFHGDFETRRLKESKNFKQPARPPPVTERRTDSTPVDRFRVSSLAPSLNRASRSQSYPQHTSSPRRLILVDRSANLSAADNVHSPSSMPPSALRHVTSTGCTQPPRPSKVHRLGSNPTPGVTSPSMYRQEKRNSKYSPVREERVQTSSDLGVVLQHCNDTFHERRQATGSRRRHTGDVYPSYLQPDVRQNTRDFHRATQQAPTVRFVDQTRYEPVARNFVGTNIYEQQARQQPSLQPEFEEDDSFDLYSNGQDYLDQDNQLECDEQTANHDVDCDELLEEHMPYGLEEYPDLYDGGEAYMGTEVEPSQDLREANDTVAPGFWRPNKLY